MSKVKGAGGELEVVKLIQPWWRQLEPEAIFSRTPGSGGWGTREARSGFRLSGDLMTTAERFPFSVEVKRRERWTKENVFEGKRSPVWAWWRQTQKSAAEMKAIPMMWFRHNREPWLAMLPDDVFGISLLFADLETTSVPRASLRQYVSDVGAFPVIVTVESLLALQPSHFLDLLDGAPLWTNPSPLPL